VRGLGRDRVQWIFAFRGSFDGHLGRDGRGERVRFPTSVEA
jgi:hypothetical protein